MGLNLLLILHALLNAANLPIDRYASVLLFSRNDDEQAVISTWDRKRGLLVLQRGTGMDSN